MTSVYLVRLKLLGFDPIIDAIDHHDTEEESLRSETEWVRKLVSDGYPLLNRWREHRDIVKCAYSSEELKVYFENRLTNKGLGA